MEKQIEKAIRETLVISNPKSIHLAVKKILLLLDNSGEYCECTHPILGKSVSRCGTCDKWFKAV
jgi:uncharacterized protein with ATP-grasp and redox domains